MNRGGRDRIARRLVTAAVMLGLGVAVIGGGVAFAGDTTDGGTPVAPGVVNYYVGTPNAPVVPAGPGVGVVTSDGWDWS